MRPTDIDQIANAIAGSLAGADPGLLGCSSISNPTAFSTSEDTDAGWFAPNGYECGGAADFTCDSTGGFGCGSAAGSPPAVFTCRTGAGGTFACTASSFTCAGTYDYDR